MNNTFFGTATLPEIDITEERLQELAQSSVSAGLTVPGVQKKLSLHLVGGAAPRLTLVGYPAGYILKPQTEEYPHLPEAEDMVMDIAEELGVRTVPHGLVETPAGYAYITKRIDRQMSGQKISGSLAMEDFCQLTERATADKYKSSYERCAAVIDTYSARSGLDKAEFFLRIVVSFLTGNSDMHLKNFSLIETAPAKREFVLSPAYDLLPVNLVLPEDTDETALTLCGKRSKFKRADFMRFAETIGINENAAEKMVARTLRRHDKALAICAASSLPQDMKAGFKELFEKRCERLSLEK
ncbi:MAG: HipA domain-containing protein, partial [Firmicutes bacterium]|nr:HipA domain-containing protein [Bacillota bacterium]